MQDPNTYRKILSCERIFHVLGSVSISRILYSDRGRSDSYLSRSDVAVGLKRFSPTWVRARSCTRV